MSSAAIGIMEGAYFVGRLELLQWLNDFFGFEYQKIEDCASAAAYCQIFDAIYPNQIPLSQVNFSAKHEYEFIQNFKILQKGFEKVQLKRNIPIQLLTRAKYQDNLEFLQWFKRYFDLNYDISSNYDGRVLRAHAIKSYQKQRSRRRKTSTLPSKNLVSATPAAPKSASKVVPTPMTQARSSRPRSSTVNQEHQSQFSRTKSKEAQTLKDELAKMKRIAKALEKERDYYFAKLQQMDLVCQSQSNLDDPFAKTIQRILYADEEVQQKKVAPEPIKPCDENVNPQMISSHVSSSPLF